MEYKTLGFDLEETKIITVNGQKIGVVKGHAAAFSRDRVADIIDERAFDETIKDHIQRNNRPIRMKFQHKRDEIIGGFPIALAKVDQKGLFVEGHINLEVQRGKEAFSLAKQGVLTDLSIGFIPNEVVFEDIEGESIRVIKEIDLREISIVDEPANMDATITEVKAIPFQDLPLSDRNRSWDSISAIARIKEFTGSTECPSDTYKKAFLWFDAKNKDDFESYKFPITDVVDGALRIVPRAVLAAKGAITCSSFDLELPETSLLGIKKNMNKHFRKINLVFDEDLEIPFKNDLIENELKFDSIKKVEEFLRDSGLSRKEAKSLISNIKNCQRDVDSQKKTESASRDASVEKLDELILIQKLDNLLSNMRS